LEYEVREVTIFYTQNVPQLTYCSLLYLSQKEALNALEYFVPSRKV